MRKSFVFYGSWWEAIKNLPRDVQGDVLTAIIEYGLTGETTEQLKPIAKAMLAMAKTQIDVNNTRFENGKKGGHPKPSDNQTTTKPKPSDNQTTTKPKPSDNQTTTKPKPNVNVNDNDKETVSTDVEPAKKGANAPKERAADAATHEPHKPSERYIRFQQWLAKECPYIPKHFEKTISEREFEKLLETYSARQLCDVISEINNRGDLRKRYTDLYRTVLNWLKRENIPKT